MKSLLVTVIVTFLIVCVLNYKYLPKLKTGTRTEKRLAKIFWLTALLLGNIVGPFLVIIVFWNMIRNHPYSIGLPLFSICFLSWAGSTTFVILKAKYGKSLH